MKLDCKEDEMTSSSTCGRSPEQACCQLQDVLNNIQEGGTLHVLQHQTARKPECDKTEEIQVEVTKSFTLKTLPPEERLGVNSTDRGHLHGVQIMFNSNCSEQCSLTISESQFSCSWIGFNNLDIRIEDSQFMDSFITARAQLGNQGKTFNMKIQDSEFTNSFPVNIDAGETPMNNGPCKLLNYVCLNGNWNSVEIVGSILEGDRQSQVSGVEVTHANIKTLNIVRVSISFMFFALVSQSSRVDMFNVSDCIFLGNRDGIDIGEGVRYMLVSGSQMNNTGSWFGGDDVHCSSAVKGSAQTIIVENSVFAHNQASGKECKGAALSLRHNSQAVHLLESNNENSENGVVTSYDAKLLIQIVASTFLRNKVYKGAGLYLSMSDKQLSNYSQNRSNGQVLSSRIVIEMSAFTQNVAEFGGGLMTELTESTLDNGGHISTLIYNSIFSRNSAIFKGAGVHLNYFNVSIQDAATINIQICNTDFKENNSTDFWDGQGGGISIEFTSLTLMSSVAVKTTVNNCSFISNTAWWYGGGICTEVSQCSVHGNSSIILQTTRSIFTSNTAKSGAAIKADILYCSVASKSSITLPTIGSTFSSNIAKEGGAGIEIEMYRCTVYSHSSITLLTTGSSFLANTAGYYGAGIETGMFHCQVGSNSSITLRTIGSTFISNKADFGPGIYTMVDLPNVSSNSSITIETIKSTFISNVAQKNGAGVSVKIKRISIHPSSFLTMQVINCSFKSSRAERGAGLFLEHYPDESCVSGQVDVAIIDCMFQNNSASREGGSLYLKVFQITEVHIKQTEFEGNQALPGSGLYRENIGFQTCSAPKSLGPKPQAIITTYITQCEFFDSIDTGIVVKDKGRYGSVAITKCSFRNNRCINSSFAEEVFSEIDLELTDTNILKANNHQKRIGMSTQSDAKLKNVTVNISGASNQHQFSIALFSHYITLIGNVNYMPAYHNPKQQYIKLTNNLSLNYQCPAFFQPILSTAGLTDTGASMVRTTCDACFEGYYIGQTWMTIAVQNDSESLAKKNILWMNGEK